MSTVHNQWLVALAKLLSFWCLFKNHTFCMYKKGCENSSQSLSVSTSEILSKQTFLSVFPDTNLTEAARKDPKCGYARSAYENITCSPGFVLVFCSCFAFTIPALVTVREGHVQGEELSDTDRPTQSDLFPQLNML